MVCSIRPARSFCLPLLLIAWSCAGVVDAQTPRIEVHPLYTSTVSDRQFLSGSTEERADVIAGELRLPKLGSDRLPAVVLSHGSSGAGAIVDRWAQELNAIGVAAFIVDHFSGRGIASVVEDQNRLGTLTMITDLYRALDLLARHPRIDPSKIGVMGFSRGGRAALYASLKRFQRMKASPGIEFAVYLPFYAPCNVRYVEDEDVSSRPIRLFHGEADDWVPVAPCRAYVKRLRAKGADIELYEYPGAYHTFDNPLLTSKVFLPNAQTARNCFLEEDPNGQLISTKSAQPFTFDDPCVERGTTLAYDAASHAASIATVKQVLSSTVGLK
jgi:dienelactone hydrolase